jgi:hypothetical protein
MSFDRDDFTTPLYPTLASRAQACKRRLVPLKALIPPGETELPAIAIYD